MLAIETLQQHTPSVFAEHAWEGVSPKYSFLSTAQVVNALAERNIRPYSARQSYTRIDGKRGYTKHMLRFRPADSVTIAEPRIVGSVYPEIVLTNSHNRASSFCIELGLFRLVCSNGMVVNAGGAFEAYRVRHVGATIGDVLDATYSIIDQFPRVVDRVKEFQSIQLTQEQREHYAALATGLRWDADKIPFEASRLLATRRATDVSTDLWTTYNVVQENLIRGQRGQRRGWYRSRIASTREVKSIDTDLDINRGLWKLTEETAVALATV